MSPLWPSLVLLALQGPGERTISLDEAIDLALRASPSMVQARGNVSSAAGERLSAYGAFLPTVTASSGFAQSSATRWDPNTNRFVQGTQNTNYSAGLSASLDLFTGFRRWSEVRSSDAALRAAEADETAQRYGVIAATKRGFYDAVAARDLVAVAEARLRRAEEQAKFVGQKLQLGLATRSDSLRARLEVGNARLEVIRSRQTYRNAKAGLARQVGSDIPVAPAPAEVLARPVPPVDSTALRDWVRERAPGVASAAARFRAAETSLSAAKGSYWPSLSASYSTTWNGPEFFLSDNAQFGNSWVLRVNFSYPLFNGFSREANVARARANRRVAEAQLHDARRAADAGLTETLGALATAQESAAIAEDAVAAAEEDLRVQQERYRLGVSTLLEVLTSQAALAQAQTDRVQAQLEVQRAIGDLEALLGETLP